MKSLFLPGDLPAIDTGDAGKKAGYTRPKNDIWRSLIDDLYSRPLVMFGTEKCGVEDGKKKMEDGKDESQD
jgi:hypothetical protein